MELVLCGVLGHCYSTVFRVAYSNASGAHHRVSYTPWLGELHGAHGREAFFDSMDLTKLFEASVRRAYPVRILLLAFGAFLAVSKCV